MAIGIDYGRGITNIDLYTGIRYGVIPLHYITDEWCESAEAVYGDACCPKCGIAIKESCEYEDLPDNKDFHCEDCRKSFWSHEVYGDDPIAWVFDSDECKATQSVDSCDIFVIKSPYYTKAAFCSPCAPGACYLPSPHEDGERAYCFHPDWFDESVQACPYPVYLVTDNSLIYTPK